MVFHVLYQGKKVIQKGKRQRLVVPSVAKERQWGGGLSAPCVGESLVQCRKKRLDHRKEGVIIERKVLDSDIGNSTCVCYV